MEHIYTGFEKKIHYILAKRVIKRYNINPDDIATVYFNCLKPSDTMPLWTVKVSIYDAACNSYSDNFYTKDCIRHSFFITWANLKKGKF